MICEKCNEKANLVTVKGLCFQCVLKRITEIKSLTENENLDAKFVIKMINEICNEIK